METKAIYMIFQGLVSRHYKGVKGFQEEFCRGFLGLLLRTQFTLIPGYICSRLVVFRYYGNLL